MYWHMSQRKSHVCWIIRQRGSHYPGLSMEAHCGHSIQNVSSRAPITFARVPTKVPHIHHSHVLHCFVQIGGRCNEKNAPYQGVSRKPWSSRSRKGVFGGWFRRVKKFVVRGVFEIAQTAPKFVVRAHFLCIFQPKRFGSERPTSGS